MHAGFVGLRLLLHTKKINTMPSPLKDMFRGKAKNRGGSPHVAAGGHQGFLENINEENSVDDSAMQIRLRSEHLIDVSEAGATSTSGIRSMRTWDVKMGPLKKQMVKGLFVGISIQSCLFGTEETRARLT